MPMSTPVPDRNHFPSQLALLVVAIAMLVPYLYTSGYHGDEFTNLNDAVRQLHGQVIYRDFFEFAAPLSSWIAAAVFCVTGPSLFAARLVQSGALLSSVWQLYALARRLEVRPWLALLPGVILLGSLYRAWPGYSHHWLLLPLILGALQAAMRAQEGRAWLWLLAGALAGTATLDMQTDGPVLCFALGAWALADTLLVRENWQKALGPLVMLAFGFAFPLGLAGVYFETHGALAQAVESVWLWPFHHYKQPGGFNDIPYGSDWLGEIQPIKRSPLWLGRAYHLSCTYFLAPLAALGGLVWGARTIAQRRWSPTQARLVLVLLLALCDFFLVTHGRADYPRIAIYAVPAVLVLCAFADAWLRHGHRKTTAYVPIVLLALYAGTGVFLQSRYMTADPATWLRFSSPDQRIADLPVMSYLRQHTQAGDRLVVFPDGGAFYFYARPAATRYTLIYPAKFRYMAPAELREVWREIAQSKPKFMVLGPYGFNGQNISDFFPRGVPRGYQRVPRSFNMDGRPVWLYRRISDSARATGIPSASP